MEKKPAILIVKIGALGDLFFALPCLSYFKNAFPSCSIDWLVTAGLADALKSFKEIDNVIPIDGDKIYGGNIFSKIWNSLLLRTKIKKYDAILLLHRHPAYLIPLFGKGRIFQLTRSAGFVDAFASTTPVPPLTTHESLAIRKTAEKLVFQLGGKRVAEWKINLLAQSSGKIFVHLGGGDNAKTEFRLKRWPEIAKLVENLIRSRNETIVLVGSPAEKEVAEQLERSVSNPQRLENLVGKTTLPELVREIASAKIFIGPDSGPLHIADQLGVPSVGIYGPTSPVSWGLIGPKSKAVSHQINCHPCYRDDGKFPECTNEHRCMKDLTTERVSSVVVDVLNSAR